MFDLILNILLIIIVILMSIFLDLDNGAIECLIEMIPLVILSVRFWLNTPKVYLHIMTLTKRVIKYSTTIMFQCSIDREMFNSICERIKTMYGQDEGANILSVENDGCLYKRSMEIDACLVTVSYENDNLYIETSSKTFFRAFYKDVQKLSEVISTCFAESNNKIERKLAEIKINYLGRKDNRITNPFVNNFYGKFDEVFLEMSYKTKNKTKITINNQCIIFNGIEINLILNDIKKEMLLL